MSKNDLMSMVRFGADEIFSSKQGTITDEDIDVILKHGEERSAEQATKIQSDVQHNLANFSLTTEDGAESSLFDFDGTNYKGAKGSKGLMINLPQRERKRNYDVDEYFRDALRQGEKPAARMSEQRKRRGPPMHDFQFFEREALETLLTLEDDLAMKRSEAVVFIKELRTRNNRSEEDAEEASKRADELEANLDVEYELTPSDRQRKDKLLSEGFGDWTRKDLRAFTGATERRGRADVESLCRETAAETGKSEEDVVRYHGVFWERYKEISEWERIIEKVERGEKRLQRSKEMREALKAKVERHPKPWQRLPLNYGASRGKVWTEEEDAFLINMMHLYGYGNWERIRVEIRSAWQFNFDWFFKSRNAAELQRRADLLIRLVEKENEEHAKNGNQPAPAPVAPPPAVKKAPGAAKPRQRKRSAAAPADVEAAPVDEQPPAVKMSKADSSSSSISEAPAEDAEMARAASPAVAEEPAAAV